MKYFAGWRYAIGKGKTVKQRLLIAAAAMLLCMDTALAGEPQSGHARPIIKDCADCPEMVQIPAGDFVMGNDGDYFARPAHRVSIRSFGLAKTELTVGQFRRFVRATGYRTTAEQVGRCWVYGTTGEGGEDAPGRYWDRPGFKQSDDHPATCISLVDARAYLRWMSRETRQHYRLPSEAEWEYAARGGSTTKWIWGNDANGSCQAANIADRTMKEHLPKLAGPVSECHDKHVFTAPVGSFHANGFGLYDMIGNVDEWTDDCAHTGYAGAPVDGSSWRDGDACDHGMLGSGSFGSDPESSLVTTGRSAPTLERSIAVGFRPARSATPSPAVVTKRIDFTTRARMSGFKDCPDCPVMVKIPAGQFDMGASGSETVDDLARPLHQVKVPAFALSETPITQGQWKSIMGKLPADWRADWNIKVPACGDDCPVEEVSWNAAQEYLRRLSEKTGRAYRLPSEAEWEYACRAGTRGTDCDGANKPSRISELIHEGHIQPVARNNPNRFGLYDMTDNVEYWVQDCWHGSYDGAPTDGSAWLTNPQADRPYAEEGICDHVVRGRAFLSKQRPIRTRMMTHPAFYREKHGAKENHLALGFRVAVPVEP